MRIAKELTQTESSPEELAMEHKSINSLTSLCKRKKKKKELLYLAAEHIAHTHPTSNKLKQTKRLIHFNKE